MASPGVDRQGRSAASKRWIAPITATFLIAVAVAAFVLPYAHPRPPSITVRRIGPDFNVLLDDTTGGTKSMPTPPGKQQPNKRIPGPGDCIGSVEYGPPGFLTTSSASSEALGWVHDEACGPLRFEPSPEPNREMRLDIEVTPSMPRAGQVVTFRINAVDKDAQISRNCPAVSYGANVGGPQCGISLDHCPVFYGTWNRLTPAPSDRHEFEFRNTYRDPGAYTATFEIYSGSGYKPFCGFPNPYSDIVLATVELVVIP